MNSEAPYIKKGAYLLINISETELKNLPNKFCDSDDLNDFFKNECWKFDKELLTKTYKLVLENYPKKVLGLVSLCNDALSTEKLSNNEKKRNIPNGKRMYDDYPAVKIARLAINKNFTHLKLGSMTISLIKEFFITNNKTGCRFVTVDAYTDVLKFYEKNKFVEIKNQDADEPTRSMYYNLDNVHLDHTTN